MIEVTVGRDRVRTAYRVTPFGAHGDSTRLAMTTNLDISGRSGLGQVEWLLLGGHSYERTRRILQQDLEDIAAEVSRRPRRSGKHAA